MNQPRNQPQNGPRIPREQETRAAEMKSEFDWKAPETLPTPNPRDGIVYRYIRVSTLGESDAPNVSKARREGWEPVLASEVPEIAFFAEQGSKFRDNVEIGGLLLCKNTEERMRQRAAHFNRLTQGQMQSVDQNLMKENDTRTGMQLFKNAETRVSFGKGST